MKVSQFQITQLFLIAVDSLKIKTSIAFEWKERKILVDEIINQQSSELQEYLKEPPK